jgi:hypothetical protein
MSRKENIYIDAKGQVVPEPVAHLHAVKVVVTEFNDRNEVIGREWFNSSTPKPPMPADEEE